MKLLKEKKIYKDPQTEKVTEYYVVYLLINNIKLRIKGSDITASELLVHYAEEERKA